MSTWAGLICLVHLYKTPSKSRRWYFPLFAYSLDVSIVNAWLLYKRDCFALNENIMPLKDFRISVGKSLANQRTKFSYRAQLEDLP